MIQAFFKFTLLALFLFACSQLAAEEIICRYCQDAESHGSMAIGHALEGRYHYAPDRQVDVLHIKIDVTPDFKRQTVSGTTSITAKPIAKPVRILRLDAVDLNVIEVRCEGAEVKDFVSSREDLRIAFAEPVGPQDKFTLHIDYSAQPRAGLYFRTPAMGYPKTDTHIWTQGETHEARHWFPCFDYPNERSSTEVICRVPDDMIVLSNGVRMGEKTDRDGLKAVRWVQKKPHVNYLICLVAGHFEKLEKQHRDIALGFYTQPTLFEHAANSFRDTEQIMEFFESEIGLPFPWDKYDQVTIRDFTAGGMENTTLTTLTHNTIFSAAGENIRTTRRLDAHEMAHQWFGDYVTCKDWSHLWLNEGFATYYTHLYEGHKFGRDAMLYGLYLDASNRILTQKNDTKPIVYNGYQNTREQFDYRAYPKGSWVLHMLRSQLGPDLYRKGIKAYLKKHALTSVVSDDLRQVLEQHSGRSLDRFFDQWLYHPRHPDLKVSYKWMAGEGLAKVTVQQTQKVDDNVLLYHFPTKLRFVVDGEKIDHEIEVSQATEDFYVPLAAQPTFVRFDPEYTVLADVSFDKSNALISAQIKDHSDMIGRLRACKLLETRKTHEAVELLTTALNEDPFFGVRIAAARALAKHESEEAYAALEKGWRKQQDARVRLAVVEKVVARYHERTPKLIAKIVKNESNPLIQAVAVRALGRFHGDESRALIADYLDRESFRNELAVAAISAMRQQNDPEYADALMDALKRDKERYTARGLSQGLSALAHVCQWKDDKADEREFLLGYINHPMMRIRTSAISALGTLGDPKAISALEAFSGSSDERIKRAADQALSKLRESKPVTPREVVDLRSEMAKMKKENEKLEKQIKAIEDQLKAKKGDDKADEDDEDKEDE